MDILCSFIPVGIERSSLVESGSFMPLQATSVQGSRFPSFFIYPVKSITTTPQQKGLYVR
jgi:hypothetical protein